MCATIVLGRLYLAATALPGFVRRLEAGRPAGRPASRLKLRPPSCRLGWRALRRTTTAACCGSMQAARACTAST